MAAQVALDERGSIATARVALLGVGEGPVLAASAASQLAGQAPSDELFRAAADACTKSDIDPHGDVHATPAYRRHLAGVLTRRALAAACAAAR